MAEHDPTPPGAVMGELLQRALRLGPPTPGCRVGRYLRLSIRIRIVGNFGADRRSIGALPFFFPPRDPTRHFGEIGEIIDRCILVLDTNHVSSPCRAGTSM